MFSLFDTLSHLFHPRFSNNHRPRILHPEGFAVLALFAIIAGTIFHQLPRLSNSSGAILGYSSTINVSTIVEQTNQKRAESGLPPLALNDTLSQAAAAKASDMFQDQYWAHFSPSGKTPWDFMKTAGYQYTVAGENLARDFMETSDMMTAWMNSPTHRENIVNDKYKEIGIAVVNGTLNGTETTLVVQMFGTPSTRAVVAQINPEAQRVTSSPLPTAIPEIETSPIIVDEAIPDLDAQTVLVQNEIMRYIPASEYKPHTVVEKTSVLGKLIPSQSPVLLSPLHLTKAFFLAMLMVVIIVILYDTMVVGRMGTVRFVGKNAGHFLLYLTIFFLVLLFRGGVIV